MMNLKVAISLFNPGLMLRWLERRKKAILFQCLSLATEVIAEPVRWDICCLISTSEHENCLKICIFSFSRVQVPALSVEVYLRSRGSSRRQSHPGISIQSQSHPIPILPRHSSLPWQLTDRVSEQIGTWSDFTFANFTLIHLLIRQSQLLLRRFVWKCHQIWPQGKFDFLFLEMPSLKWKLSKKPFLRSK